MPRSSLLIFPPIAAFTQFAWCCCCCRGVTNGENITNQTISTDSYMTNPFELKPAELKCLEPDAAVASAWPRFGDEPLQPVSADAGEASAVLSSPNCRRHRRILRPPPPALPSRRRRRRSARGSDVAAKPNRCDSIASSSPDPARRRCQPWRRSGTFVSENRRDGLPRQLLWAERAIT